MEQESAQERPGLALLKRIQTQKLQGAPSSDADSRGRGANPAGAISAKSIETARTTGETIRGGESAEGLALLTSGDAEVAWRVEALRPYVQYNRAGRSGCRLCVLTCQPCEMRPIIARAAVTRSYPRSGTIACHASMPDGSS